MSDDLREAFYDQRFQRLAKEMPDYQPEVTNTIVTLAWLHDAVLRRMNSFLASSGLSTAAFNVLTILQERQRVPLNELSTLLIKTPANITGLVDGLTKRGLVKRVPHPQDRRVKLAELSPAGRNLVDQLLPEHHARICAMFQALGKEELTSVTAMMRRVIDNLPDEVEIGK